MGGRGIDGVNEVYGYHFLTQKSPVSHYQGSGDIDYSMEYKITVPSALQLQQQNLPVSFRYLRQFRNE